MQKFELMEKRIDKNISYFADKYDNRSQYKVEWAFEDAQLKLNDFAAALKKSGCCTKEAKKKFDKKLKRSKMIRNIFSRVRLLMNIAETIISAVFVLLISEISHSVDVMIASQTISLYFLGAFALMKVLLENNFIRPVFERISWSLYKYSYEMVYATARQNIGERTEDAETVDITSEIKELNAGIV